MGIYILKPEAQAVVKKPSWWGTETIFRPYPCVSFQNPETEFEPYRIVHPDGRTRFSDWFRRYLCAWGVGQNATTYLIKKTHKFYDHWQSPLGILYKAIENACKKGEAKDPRWYPLRESGMNKGKALKPPGELFIMQGLMLRHDKTEYGVKGSPPPLGWGEKNPTCILMLSSDAGNSLADELHKEKEGFAGSPTDFESRYVHGDPVSPMNGRFLHFWERGTNPANRGSNYASKPVQQTTSFEEGMDAGADATQAGGAGKEMQKKGFDVEITTHSGGRIATFNKVGEEQIRKHWQHWDDILFFPTEIEQAHLLAKSFPATAIIYAFESVNKDWIPDECWHEVRKPKSANFHDRTEFEEPPSDDYGFAASAPASKPAVSQPAAAATTQRSAEADAWSDMPQGAAPGAEDSSVPQGTVDKATSVAEAPPVTPAPVAATPGSKEDSEAKIARLASARSKVK
jgi:hypothetical protein